jgi:hypothetical protein
VANEVWSFGFADKPKPLTGGMQIRRLEEFKLLLLGNQLKHAGV